MITYCNARMPVKSLAHSLSSNLRAVNLRKWVDASTDKNILENSKRKKHTRPRESSISVAFQLTTAQAARLSNLLDGRKNTFSSLVRNIFDREE